MESFQCLKQIRVSDKAIFEKKSRWEDNGSIYIPPILSKRYLICMAKGNFSGKRVFFGGLYLRENGAWKAFGASVLNKFKFLTKLHFKIIAMGG